MFILLSGDDEFSATEELARLRASGDFGYNQDTFAGQDADLAVIRNVCATMPFLAEKRLVVVEGLPKPSKRKGKGESGDDDESEDASAPEQPPAPEVVSATASKGKRGKKEATVGLTPLAFAKGLAEIAQTLPETTLLVAFIPEELKPDHPLMQAARKMGKSLVFIKPRGPRLEEWVAQRAQKRRIAPEAAHMLVEAIGDNPRMLAGEIDKLGTYVGAGNEIRAEDVRALTPIARQSKVFDLTDALAQRDNATALRLLHELLAQGESPLGIVALTAFQTRSLMQVKLLADKGMSAYQIAATAGIAPFVVEKSLRLARRFSFAQLAAAHRTLLEIDTALKRSRMTPELALDLLALEFGRLSER